MVAPPVAPARHDRHGKAGAVLDRFKARNGVGYEIVEGQIDLSFVGAPSGRPRNASEMHMKLRDKPASSRS